jgi:hypothetical protein
MRLIKKDVQHHPSLYNMNQYRWIMFGHILRMPEDTPTQNALEFPVVGSNKYKAHKFTHCTNLLNIPRADLRDSGLKIIRTPMKLHQFKMLPSDRVQCIQMEKDRT